MTVNTLKDIIVIKDYQTFKSNNKDVIIINNNNQLITVKKKGNKTINK